jgi:biofilm PGA synthesis N-glycosyltransferase PgaC
MLPSVSLLIAAYNEERVLESKLANSLALDYPGDRLQIIVVADGSDDDTAAIGMRHRSMGVELLHRPERRGKTAALNRGVAKATGEVVVFSDANNVFDAGALRKLVRHFRNPQVGGVCGAKHVYESNDRDSSVGDGLYWRYESALKLAESRLGSVTTADGEIFAIRRHLYVPLDERLINDDAAITFEILAQGRRVLYEPQARSFEHASIRIADDFNVKVRMVSGGFQTLGFYWRFLLRPPRIFTLAFCSHKLLRWLAPELLIALAASSLLLAQQRFFLVMSLLQALFYALAAGGWVVRHKARLPLTVYLPFYFSAMNLAAFMGLYRFLSRSTTWKKAQR